MPPTEITYGKGFNITVGAVDKIAKVTWTRLGSATRSCSQSQSLIFLD